MASDYEQTILREFQALVGKKQKVTYDKIISKIRNLLKSWGMNKVSVEDLRKKGTQCIAESDGLIPQEAASEMKTLRVMWDIGEFFKDTAVSDRHRGERSDTKFIGDDLSEAGNSRVPSLRLHLTRRVVDDTTTEPEPEPDEEDETVSAQMFNTIICSQSATERSYSSYHNLATSPIYY
ncbi:hypothetical protein B5807_01067 [Epicoccum nigrum]|uniref:Uncharacterized protein n=1 Tax=Epicoccum nigrum TaxID=105696 RepID=A0A1Y2MEJ5_EPING|nr:hypothetical protein B5807_01067 [Epicoccum nigrum]